MNLTYFSILLTIFSFFYLDSKAQECRLVCEDFKSIEKEIPLDKLVVELERLEKILALSNKQNCWCKAKVKNLVGFLYYNQSEYTKAKTILLEAENVLKVENRYDEDFIRNQNYLGLIEIIEKNFDGAIFHFNRMNEMAKKKNNLELQTEAALQLGLSYLEKNELDTAKFYYQNCLNLNKQVKSDYFEGYAFQNLARVFYRKKDYEKALDYAERANLNWEKLKSRKGIYLLNIIISDIYAAKGDTSQVLNYLERSLAIYKKTGVSLNLDLIYKRLGDVYFNKNKLENAEKNYILALKNGDNLTLVEQKNILYNLSDIQFKNNDEDGLKNSINLVLNLVEKSKSKNKFQENRIIKSELNFDNKNRENLALKEDFYSKEIKFKRLTLLLYSLLGVLGFISYLMYSKWQESNKRKLLLEQIEDQKNELSKVNEELKQSTTIITQQNVRLEKINEDLQNFTYATSHDLKSPLRSIVGFATILRRKLEKEGNLKHIDLLQNIETSGKGMGEIIENLLTYAKAGTHKLSIEKASPELIFNQVKLALDKLIKENKAKVNLSTQLNEIELDLLSIKQLLQNFISNSIKYAKKDVTPIINLSINENKNMYIFKIEDNGIGIPKEYHSKIFNMFERVPNQLTAEGSGIGLATCKKLIELYKGNIEIESKEGVGTTFIFNLPKQITA